ncbi:ATP-binding protein [Streptococcus pyogenes]|uniref:ATP-binding protein n=1 Tax=Streptococcus pyogenes TaxID=1314 RepID=UPI001F60E488|nr:ATP-binding protein [Streptococcus pyogenes]
MGLKISKQIIDLHDGNMIITSTQGQYFQTVITLPIESLNTSNKISFWIEQRLKPVHK